MRIEGWIDRTVTKETIGLDTIGEREETEWAVGKLHLMRSISLEQIHENNTSLYAS